MDVNYLAIAVAAVAAMVVSLVYYGVLGNQLRQVSTAADATRPPAWKMLVEYVRSLVMAAALAGFAARLGVVDWAGAVLLGLAVWTGFVAWLYSGSVIWENVPWKLAAIHAGDALVKLPIVAVIVSVWS